MSEFGDMLKEALVGEEPFRPDEGREHLEQSVRKFERRMRTVRFMAAFMVVFAVAVMVTGLVLLRRAGLETSSSELAFYAALFIWGSLAVGLGKLWFGMMQNHVATMKELKLVQMRLLEIERRFGA